MRHKGDQCHLTHVGALACHVGTGNNQHPLRLLIHVGIIGDKPVLHGLLHHRMTPLHNIQTTVIGDFRAHIMIADRQLG